MARAGEWEMGGWSSLQTSVDRAAAWRVHCTLQSRRKKDSLPISPPVPPHYRSNASAPRTPPRSLVCCPCLAPFPRRAASNLPPFVPSNPAYQVRRLLCWFGAASPPTSIPDWSPWRVRWPTRLSFAVRPIRSVVRGHPVRRAAARKRSSRHRR